MSKKIEVEGGEIAIQNSHGDVAIIPIKDVSRVKKMLKNPAEVDAYVASLPKMSDYAEDGTIVEGDEDDSEVTFNSPEYKEAYNKDNITKYNPKTDVYQAKDLPEFTIEENAPKEQDVLSSVISILNPRNLFVTDYTDKGSFGNAYSSARKSGEKEFMYENKRYNTNYKGTPSQQLKETGITDERLQGSSELRKRIANNINPQGYGHTKSAAKAILNNTPEIPVPDDEVKGLLPTQKQDSIYNNPKPGPFEKHYFPPLEKIRGKRPAHEDALALTMGLPQKYNSYAVSEHKPSVSKNKNAIYYKLNNSEAENNILQKGLAMGNKNKKLIKAMSADNESESALGDYTISKSKDERGNYVSYYDINDYNPIGQYHTKENENSIQSPFGKPFEVYDKLYYKEYDGENKRMYYTDDELSKLDPNKKEFDSKALQIELSNRGVDLPNSTTYRVKIGGYNDINNKLSKKYKKEIETAGPGGLYVNVTKKELEEYRKELYKENVKVALDRKKNQYYHSEKGYTSYEDLIKHEEESRGKPLQEHQKEYYKKQWEREEDELKMSDNDYLIKEGFKGADTQKVWETKILDGVYGDETKAALIKYQKDNKK